MLAQPYLVENGRECSCIGWPVCLEDLEHFKRLRVHKLDQLVHGRCHHVRAILVQLHVPNLLVVQLRLLLHFARLQDQDTSPQQSAVQLDAVGLEMI